MSDFEKVMDTIENCQVKYKNEFISYMQKRISDADSLSAQYRRETADANRRISDANRNIMHNDSIRLKKSMIEFYEIYIKNPNAVKKEDIDFARESTKKVIATCKEY